MGSVQTSNGTKVLTLPPGLGIGQLPSGTRFSQIAAVSVLGGIGFTMSIFIANLAFAGDAAAVDAAKMAILAGSLCAGLLGWLWLRLAAPKPADP